MIKRTVVRMDYNVRLSYDFRLPASEIFIILHIERYFKDEW